MGKKKNRPFAIKGESARSAEIIEVFEMLGVTNTSPLTQRILDDYLYFVKMDVYGLHLNILRVRRSITSLRLRHSKRNIRINLTRLYLISLNMVMVVFDALSGMEGILYIPYRKHVVSVSLVLPNI